LKRLFSSWDVKPRERFDYWHDIACKNIVDHNSIPQCNENFHAIIEAGALSDLRMIQFENSPMAVSRTARHIGRTRDDDIFFCRQTAGELLLEQDGREVLLRPGELTLLDPMLPYSGQFFPGSTLLLLKIPRRDLEVRIGKTRNLVCREVKSGVAEFNLASSFIAAVPAHATQLKEPAATLVKDITLDLIGVALRRVTEGFPRISCGRTLVMLNIRAAVEARLRDPALDPSSVAAAVGVSVRYANSILANYDQSIGRLILDRRLERCRRSLNDPQQAHRTISEIAYGWGFSNMTYFGRMFKNAFGLSPREFRRQSVSPRP
jgi:AraC family transcriptional activator of tynA and feaB